LPKPPLATKAKKAAARKTLPAASPLNVQKTLLNPQQELAAHLEKAYLYLKAREQDEQNFAVTDKTQTELIAFIAQSRDSKNKLPPPWTEILRRLGDQRKALQIQATDLHGRAQKITVLLGQIQAAARTSALAASSILDEVNALKSYRDLLKDRAGRIEKEQLSPLHRLHRETQEDFQQSEFLTAPSAPKFDALLEGGLIASITRSERIPLKRDTPEFLEKFEIRIKKPQKIVVDNYAGTGQESPPFEETRVELHAHYNAAGKRIYTHFKRWDQRSEVSTQGSQIYRSPVPPFVAQQLIEEMENYVGDWAR
jgi:hypothetical protein